MDEEDIQYLRRKRRRIEEIDGIPKEEAEEKEVGQERKQQHTLDSDEEEETKYDRLDMNKIGGQEEATIEYDGNVKITAFNMKEDMEEGHFDDEGNFIFDKKQEDIKDAWLDGIDWNRVKQNAGTHWNKEEEEDADTDLPPQKLDEKAVYEKLLSLLSKEETIAKALKRMNSEKGLSAAEERKRRWAAKKAGTKYEDNNASAVTELTSLADSLVSAGHMEAYQLDRDSINKILEDINGKEKVALDMFADEEVQLPSSSES
uniref:CD2 antigen cytoplasmic tail-binding protein 2 n=1 Tax=Acrobeloides nanus TaxID=290746 RepID=A0A914BZV1_9BILA